MSARQRPRPARPRRGGAAVPAWTGRAQAPAMHTAPAAPRCRAEADELRIGDDQLVNVIGTSVQIDNLAGERTVMTEALVLGSGGGAGIAWITGRLAGLADASQDVTRADVIVGTSAGATVGAQLGSGLSLEEMYARQTQPELQTAEIMSSVDLSSFSAQIAAVMRAAASIPDMRRTVGRFALGAATVPEPERRVVIASRLASQGWPARALKIVAVDAESGEPRVFDKASGVSLVDAVMASCARLRSRWPRPSRSCARVAQRSRSSGRTRRRGRRSAGACWIRPRASQPRRRDARRGVG